VCTATVYSLCESGGLAHVRLNNAIRVSEDDLQRYLEKLSKRPR
jgi:excisionase family DNA binding protein